MTFKIPFIKLIKSIKAVDLVVFFSYSVILLTFDYSNNNKFTNVSIQYLLWKQLNPVSIIILNTFFSHFQRTFKKTTGTLKNGLRYILYTECIPTPAWSGAILTSLSEGTLPFVALTSLTVLRFVGGGPELGGGLDSLFLAPGFSPVNS